QIAQSTDAADVEVLEPEVLVARARATPRACPGPRRTRSAATPRTTEPAERTEAAHVVVLFALLGVTQNRVRLGDFLEALRRLRVVGVLVRVMLGGEPS